MKTFIVPVFDVNERQFGCITVLAPSEEAAIGACLSDRTPWTDADNSEIAEVDSSDNGHDIECDEDGNITFSIYDDEKEEDKP